MHKPRLAMKKELAIHCYGPAILHDVILVEARFPLEFASLSILKGGYESEPT